MQITSKKGKIFELIEENKTKVKNSQTNPIRNHHNTSNTKRENEKTYSTYYSQNKNNNYYKSDNIPYMKSNYYPSSNNNRNYNHNTNYNNNTHYNNLFKSLSKGEISKGIEQRRISLKYPQPSPEELNDITEKIAKLKINFCVQCQRIGHLIEECPENEDHLN